MDTLGLVSIISFVLATAITWRIFPTVISLLKKEDNTQVHGRVDQILIAFCIWGAICGGTVFLLAYLFGIPLPPSSD